MYMYLGAELLGCSSAALSLFVASALLQEIHTTVQYIYMHAHQCSPQAIAGRYPFILVRIAADTLNVRKWWAGLALFHQSTCCF